jgi:hypothetical protein
MWIPAWLKTYGTEKVLVPICTTISNWVPSKERRALEGDREVSPAVFE